MWLVAASDSGIVSWLLSASDIQKLGTCASRSCRHVCYVRDWLPSNRLGSESSWWEDVYTASLMNFERMVESHGLEPDFTPTPILLSLIFVGRCQDLSARYRSSRPRQQRHTCFFSEREAWKDVGMLYSKAFGWECRSRFFRPCYRAYQDRHVLGHRRS